MYKTTSDYEQLCALIALESKLIELRAQLRLGLQTSFHVEQVGWELGWRQIRDTSGLSLSCADVLSSINAIGEEIIPGKWADEVASGNCDRSGYEQEFRDIKEKEPVDDNKIELNNFTFRKLYGSPHDTAGYVYIQDTLPRDANYCIRTADGDEEVIAVFSSLDDAIAAARYSASHDGGYGDVCIATSSLPTTHTDFDDWFIN